MYPMMSEKISTTIEDYLVTIFVLERDGELVNGARLAELLSVTPPTVTNTLKRMVRDGLVTMDAAHLPHLTPTGQEVASSVLRKHMLAEWMLTPMLSWSKLHKEAHELEHAISSEVEAALLVELHHPEVCPHGNPLPGHERAASGWIPLTLAPLGARGVIRRIHEFAENDATVLSFLEAKHIAPGQAITIEEILPFNESITIQVGDAVHDRTVSLNFTVARYIYFEPIP